MGKICSCNELMNENNEFYGFNNKDNNKKYIIKKNFNNYDDKDKIFYEKTVEYDKIIKDQLKNEKEYEDDEPKEYTNGTVKIIRI